MKFSYFGKLSFCYLLNELYLEKSIRLKLSCHLIDQQTHLLKCTQSRLPKTKTTHTDRQNNQFKMIISIVFHVRNFKSIFWFQDCNSDIMANVHNKQIQNFTFVAPDFGFIFSCEKMCVASNCPHYEANVLLKLCVCFFFRPYPDHSISFKLYLFVNYHLTFVQHLSIHVIQNVNLIIMHVIFHDGCMAVPVSWRLAVLFDPFKW